jgi:hypothetical protein
MRRGNEAFRRRRFRAAHDRAPILRLMERPVVGPRDVVRQVVVPRPLAAHWIGARTPASAETRSAIRFMFRLSP